jgi:aquaporin related protein
MTTGSIVVEGFPFFIPSSMAPEQNHTPENKTPPAKKEGPFANLRADLWGASLEFVGTFFFLLLAFGGVQAASVTQSPSSGPTFLLYASMCFGFSLLVSAWLFFRVTGGLFNPNVSLALMVVGIILPVRFVLYCVAQMVGAIAAAGVILALTPGPCSFK